VTAVALPRNRTALDRVGYVLVMPDDVATPVPMCCPLCDRAMASSDDEASFLEHGCCHACELEWVQPDRAAWSAGRRPERAQVASRAALRPPITLRLEVD